MSDVAVYESASGQIAVTVEHDSVWLRQEQLAELFGRDRTVIGRHIRNVFAEGELERESNVQNLHIASICQFNAEFTPAAMRLPAAFQPAHPAPPTPTNRA